MQIILAKHSGFCEGVERAYKIALDAVSSKKPVFILGDLVHNKDVVHEFRELGVKKADNIRSVPQGATLIITAHGTTPEILDEARKLSLNVVDTTCPWVKRAQKLAEEISRSGRELLIVGDNGHPEVVGLVGWALGRARVVSGPKGLERLKLGEKAGIIAQTTQSKDNFDEMVNEAKKRVKDLKVYNTICGATSKRQCSARDLSREVDLMLVIGDKKSANTKRLLNVCSLENVPTRQIQNASELDLSWLKGKRKVGITAGASTPDHVIKEVVEKIKKYA